MRTIVRLTSCVLFIACASLSRAAEPSRLWYDKPATDWEKEALPIGNGRIGAMVFGGVASERLQVSEKSLWTGGPGSEGGYDYGLPTESQASAVAAAGKQLLDGAALAPEVVAKQLGRKMRNYGDYQSFGDLLIELESTDDPVSGYRRELDLDAGVARVKFKQGMVGYRRSYFVSYPDQVLVARWISTGTQKLRIRYTVPDNRGAQTRVEAAAHGALIKIAGALNSNGLKYAVEVAVLPDCGQVVADGDAARYEGDCAVTVLVAARTDYLMKYPDYRAPGVDPAQGAARDIAAAVKRTFPVLMQRHGADHAALYSRVQLDFGAPASKLPTDRLRTVYGTGDAAADRALEQLYFNYGRYLLIASSRAGALPANLQGVWNDKASPPWNADYHVNINLQMNYWPAESANLAEAAIPLFDFVDSLVVPGRLAAQRYFGAPGWTMFLNTNAWGYAGPIDWPTAFWQPEAAAWLAQHFHEHYLFSGDEKFLRSRAWPVMKGAAEFWLTALATDPRDGKLVVAPSYSPEHGPFTAGAAMSQQIVADLFTRTAQVARQVGDKAFATRLDAALAQLDPGLRVGKWGQLQEWKADLDDARDDHRHVSHLFALHPAHAIDPLTTPALAQAARKTLEARGDASTGWSRAWKINFWARLRDGDRAHKLLAGLLRDSTLPNLWDTHPPFQIDGNFGATAGMIEMLLQSQNGVIDVLPALPKEWPSGRVSGLRARGDVTVAVEWDGCGARRFELTSGRDGPLSVRSSLFGEGYEAVAGKGLVPRISPAAGGEIDFAAHRGATYTFTRKTAAGECKHADAH
ncbi:MAG TPA: glycoside hydrolase family 95 protein [Steroidobacteraceae bacterium]|nr:glycoside hydrolase family 95 protein [Steroidobacteraceae bacterium]